MPNHGHEAGTRSEAGRHSGSAHARRTAGRRRRREGGAGRRDATPWLASGHPSAGVRPFAGARTDAGSRRSTSWDPTAAHPGGGGAETAHHSAAPQRPLDERRAGARPRIRHASVDRQRRRVASPRGGRGRDCLGDRAGRRKDLGCRAWSSASLAARPRSGWRGTEGHPTQWTATCWPP